MMWELIAANRRKSLALFAGMALILCLLGYGIGYTVEPNGGGHLGLFIAVSIWFLLTAMSVFGGGSLLLRLSRARPVSPEVHPVLWNVVEEMKIASGLTAMPKVYIIDERAPNAFATGLRPEESAIVVTAGLLSRLNRDELQGVIAHEMAHIVNRDVQFMTLAGIMLGSIVLLSQVFLRGMWLAPGRSRRYTPKSTGKIGPQGHIAIVFITIALAILGPLLARIFYFAISRKREYLADASAVRFTRYPDGLANALEKISANTIPLGSANKVTAPMFIVNPLETGDGVAASGLGGTHPPIHERIAILRSMTRGASLLQYQRAFSKARGKPTMIVPSSGLKKDKPVAIREPHPDTVKPKTNQGEIRDVMDLMRAVNGFAFLICACGLKIKVPPEFDESRISCPRCKRENEIPKAQVTDVAEAAAVIGAMVGTLAGGGQEEIPTATQTSSKLRGAGAPPLEYRRKSDGWETFYCSCGRLQQLSPAFSAHQLNCRECGRIINVDPARSA
jgi:heat shock protein HtpX